MKVDRMVDFSFSEEEIEPVKKIRRFLGDMNHRDYTDLEEAVGFNGEFFATLDNLYNFMCENLE